MERTIRIPRRFHGPPESGNGGYVAGLLGACVQGASAVRLYSPPPLEVDLEVRREDATVVLARGETVVARARPTEVALEVPDPPGFGEAQEASERFRGFALHPFPSCFVCGPRREAGDGLRIFPGPVRDRDVVACPWIPDESLASDDGVVAPEFVWSALDCPGGFAFPAPASGAMLLGEIAVELAGTVSAGERCVLLAWEVDRRGRKHTTGSALFGESGACRAVALGIWLEVPGATEAPASPGSP